LLAWNLPALNNEWTYQIWLIDPQGNRISAGMFRPRSDQPYTAESISSNLNYSNFTGIGVTVEPKGGSGQPTGKRIFKVDF
jgi:anti-sigma-K factor RskA